MADKLDQVESDQIWRAFQLNIDFPDVLNLPFPTTIFSLTLAAG